LSMDGYDGSFGSCHVLSRRDIGTGNHQHLDCSWLLQRGLGRSVGQIAILVDGLVSDGIRVICIKEGMELNGKRDMKSKVILIMFSLMAEIERDLVSERTKEGLKRARAEGKLLGRPKGTTSSKLDGKEQEIQGYLAKGVNLANVARIFGVSWSTMKHFVASRGLEG